jgi:hypothetical protein
MRPDLREDLPPPFTLRDRLGEELHPPLGQILKINYFMSYINRLQTFGTSGFL